MTVQFLKVLATVQKVKDHPEKNISAHPRGRLLLI